MKINENFITLSTEKSGDMFAFPLPQMDAHAMW